MLGSNASLTASPIKMSKDNVVASTIKLLRTSHGACRLFLPCDSNSPSDGDPGGMPKPRKSSDVNVVSDALRIKGIKVNAETMAFGKIWRKIITRSCTPKALAAVT